MSENLTWWNEVVDNPTKKDIVFVCQGTVSPNYADTVIPTMESLEDRPNTILIVALGCEEQRSTRASPCLITYQL
jgi:hypothetical protein